MTELDPDGIAAAALAIADKRGVAGFSMRAVADALSVTPMALYHHVKDKAALAALVVDSAIRKNPLPPPTGNWRDDLLAMAQWMRDSTLNHPVVSHLRREFEVWTPSMLRMTERWLSLWQQSGLTLEQALLAATTSSMAITGLVHEESIYRAMKIPDNATLSFLPNVRTMFKANRNRDADFELVVRSVIEGLHARLINECKTTLQTKSTKLSRPGHEKRRTALNARPSAIRKANRRTKA
jgi:AcrR family transcriptional regulator